MMVTRRSSEAATFDALGIRVDSVELTRSPLTTYATVNYTLLDSATPALRELARGGLDLRFVDEQGQRLPFGMTMMGSIDSADDLHYTSTESLNLTALPETVRLQAYDYMNGTVLGEVSLQLNDTP